MINNLHFLFIKFWVQIETINNFNFIDILTNLKTMSVKNVKLEQVYNNLEKLIE